MNQRDSLLYLRIFFQGTDSIPFSLISVHLEPNASGKKQRAKEFEGIVKYIQKET